MDTETVYIIFNKMDTKTVYITFDKETDGHKNCLHFFDKETEGHKNCLHRETDVT